MVTRRSSIFHETDDFWRTELILWVVLTSRGSGMGQRLVLPYQVRAPGSPVVVRDGCIRAARRRGNLDSSWACILA
jgi:hypothetical protein